MILMHRFSIALCALFIWILLPQPLTAQENGSFRQQAKLMQAYRYLENAYVNEVEMAPLVEHAIEAMLGELDPHSAYIDTEQMKGITASFDGEFSGIGIEFNLLRDTIIVVNTIIGGPAERVGMRPNDRIVRIDSLLAVGMKMDDIPNHLRGETGSKVDIEVVRHGEAQPLHFTLTRDKIPLNTVDAAYTTTAGHGYIKVNRFGRTTMSEFREAFERLGRPDRLILDLRGNSGGLLEQAIEMAGFFLPAGSEIVSTEGRIVSPQYYETTHDGTNLKGRVVILVDGASASASEIVAGAIQDWDRGIIIGQPTFGKGLVQRQVPFGDGSAMRITIARYRTPSGRLIQRPYKQGARDEYLQNRRYTYDTATLDSLDAKTPLHYTLRLKRPVHGEGGIRPDLLVEEDTTGYSPYYARLIRRGVVNGFVVETMDRIRDSLERIYPDIETFAEGFEVDDSLLQALAELANTQGIPFDQVGFEEASALMRIQLKALVAQRLFNIEAFYRIMNPAHCEAYRRAGELLDQKDPWQKMGFKR